MRVDRTRIRDNIQITAQTNTEVGTSHSRMEMIQAIALTEKLEATVIEMGQLSRASILKINSFYVMQLFGPQMNQLFVSCLLMAI